MTVVVELDFSTQTRVIISNERLQNWQVYMCLVKGGKGQHI